MMENKNPNPLNVAAGKRNYKNGRNKEYKIIKGLKEQGFDIAQRSAGSHSPVDVWAVDLENKEILLIQAKPNNFPDKEVEKIMENNKQLNGKFNVEFKVV